ncbi:MAG: acyl carrier protein [Ignavibacteriaceae bacterium]|nr:acyl carrier protein [Ignavibacteriaceae bacterium]
MITPEFKASILRELHLDDYDIKDETLANQIPGWDSINHINVISAIEKDFNVRFKSIEILKCKNIGDLQNLLTSKLSKK